MINDRLLVYSISHNLVLCRETFMRIGEAYALSNVMSLVVRAVYSTVTIVCIALLTLKNVV